MMSKSLKTGTAKKLRRYYSIHPWECKHFADHSEIAAYVEASGKWETILKVNRTSGVSAEAMATYICSLINESQPNKDLLRDAMEALEQVLEDEGLTFASEQAAEHTVRNIKQVI